MLDSKIVHHSTYKSYKYYITYNSYWYCAYIAIPKSHPLYLTHYDSILNLNVHGGFSFCGFLFKRQWCIGWDYAHAGDYNPMFPNAWDFGIPNHKWTIEEIIEECKNVIDQL